MINKATANRTLLITDSCTRTVTMEKPRPKTIEEYINAAPKESMEKLRELRDILKEVAPEVNGTNA